MLNHKALLATALLIPLTCTSALAQDRCLAVVGDGIGFREDPWVHHSNVIAWFDTGVKFYDLRVTSEGWRKLQLTYDINNRDAVGWIPLRNLRPTRCP